MKKFFEFTKKHRDIIFFVLGIALYILIMSLLDITCIIKHITGISCPGCGMTRALKSLVLFDFKKALYYNPASFLLIPTAIVIIALTVKKKYKARRYFVYAVALLLIAVYIYRFAFEQSNIVVFEPENGLIAKFFKWLF